MRIVSFNLTHDSSVCSYVDGNIEFYCKEERLSKVKRDHIPYLALEKYKQQDFGKVDHFLYLVPLDNMPVAFYNFRAYVKKFFNVKLENFSIQKHHDCHASLSFYNSGFSEALVFVVDRNGSIYFDDFGNPLGRESESVYISSYPDNITPLYKSFWTHENQYKYSTKESLRKICNQNYGASYIEVNTNNPWSIVKVYEAATTLIGQNGLENGKTMGLSSYGEDIDYPSLFLDGSPISNYFTSLNLTPEFESESSCFFGFENKRTSNINPDNYQLYANKAKHVQLETQKEVLRLIEKFIKQTGIKNVCLCGGYALNVVANNFYIKNLSDVNFYFEPLSDDSGITIGACMLKYRTETKDSKIYKMEDNFFHFYEDIENNICGESKEISDLVTILEDQKIIAIFDGNPEAGPRALGHRSLLFDPRNKNGKDIVNTLKNREWYRPFAGIILEEHFKNYFCTLGLNSSEFMTINFECKNGVKEYVPSIVHVDNTCRIQTVSANNLFLFNLLTQFYKKTGCPMLLNTSFNLAGDPLIQTKKDVINFTNKVKDNSFFSGTYFVQEKFLLTNTVDIE